jgi:hypothetical protein
MKQRYTAQQVAQALIETKGMVYIAAQRLGCDPDTIRNYCKRYPTVQAARDAERGRMIDIAELKLYQSIQNGEAWGITLCLKTLGKDRGYVEQQKVALTDPSGEQAWEPTVGLAVLLEAARTRLAPPNGHPLALPREETE